MKKLPQFLALWTLLLAIAGGVRAEEKPRFNFAVVCTDASLQGKVSKGITDRLTKANVEISSNFPQGKLILFLARDVNDRRNPSGVSVAVAHVSNVPTAALALDLIRDKKEQLPARLSAMLQEEGFLEHLNVAHLDEASDEQIATLLDSLVTTFLKKYSNPKS